MEYSPVWLSEPEVFEVNRAKAHSDHDFYAVKDGKRCPLRQSLNGAWRFSYAENPQEREKDFYKEEPSEFAVTPYVREKNNRLAVEVYQGSSASWLEDQDFWRFSRIFCDVVSACLKKKDIGEGGCRRQEAQLFFASGEYL